ncbi:hypothetical protein TraAM80_07475 [Trypanosoma rangeli]|uniref:Uncharacterized protein n=1 Tax=Trypanosoma rangeli TaxID=5698 RepID=A0A3S5IQJ7_TRYRA|nr:uncharacterized protein TraAM80_07475 [Trypanosoma rangeli]RNF00657.1 hypothetical protein TraAM80_07475 [Trypanosoma rangeli]|eukprot:RNF00657.1 hypothetical protein TraAM80_07475 [Trypanosoma rangeli]
MEQICRSAASGTAESSSLSSVSVVGDEWVSIRAYFMEVQAAADDVAFAELAGRLPQVERSLEVIQKSLVRERQQMMLPRLVSQSRTVDVCNTNSVSSRNGVSMMPQGSSSLNHSSSSTNYFRIKTSTDGVSRLPPCYAFLWGELSSTSQEEGNTEAEEELAPIGHVFLLSLCQFAKHNDPPGARRIILRFLTRVFAEADLPRPPCMGDPPQSLLQLFPSNTVVPLIDMLRQVVAVLRPKTAGETEALGTSSTSYTSESSTETMDNEREALLGLLCALTERMEEVPALGMFFIPEAVTDAQEEDEEEADPESGPDSPPTVRSHFSILQELLVYATLCQGSEQSTKRCTIYQLALQGLLSLAKCPDPQIQDYVKKQTVVASATLVGARSTLLTLCKLPYKDDTFAQLKYLSDVLRFWSQLLLLSPAVAEAWSVEAMMESSFVCDALVPLFCSAEDNVYATAALVAAKTMRFVGSSPPLYVAAVTRALLNTRVDLLTGNPVRLPVSSNEVPSATSSTVSLLDYALLPRLAMRNDGDWSCTEVTLYLLETFALHEPVLFMEFAFSLSIAALAEVYVNALHHSLLSKPKLTAIKPPLFTKVGDNTAITNPSPGKAQDVDWLQQFAFNLDLSAATTSPSLDITDCFSARLRASRGILLSTHAEDIAEEILARLLLVESHVPVCILEKRQRVINRSCRSMGEEFVGFVLEGGNPGGALQETSFVFPGKKFAEGTPNNIWFHTGVHQSSLVGRLCEITSQMLATPSSVCTLLTQLWSTICVLPDFRVLYTLMDSEHGQLRQALFKLRDAIDEALQHDEDVVFALASAAAAFATNTKKKARSVEVGSGDTFPAEGSSPTSLVHNTASRFYTRAYLYSQFIQLGNSLCWVKNLVKEDFPNHELLFALKKHRGFLEACACIEAFRMELDAAIGHVALSHNLMCLQIGKEQAQRVPS